MTRNIARPLRQQLSFLPIYLKYTDSTQLSTQFICDKNTGKQG